MAGKVKENTKLEKDHWEEVREEIDGQKKVVSLVGTGSYGDYKFDIVRLKDNETKEEKLSISAFHKEIKESKEDKGVPEYEWKDYGTIITRLARLDADIKQLNDYGINLNTLDFNNLVLAIRKAFYELPLEWKAVLGNNVTEEALINIVKYFKKYFIKKNEGQKIGCYNIDVNTFSSEYKGSTFRYDEKEVREALRLHGYTRCTANRNDNVVKLDGKTGKRCISFYADKIDEVKLDGE